MKVRTWNVMLATQSGGSDLTKKTAPGLLYAVHTRPRWVKACDGRLRENSPEVHGARQRKQGCNITLPK